MSEQGENYYFGDSSKVWAGTPDAVGDEPLRVILARIEGLLNSLDDRVGLLVRRIRKGDALAKPHFDVPIKPADDGWNYSHDRDCIVWNLS